MIRNWWRDWRETLMWSALALLVVAHVYERKRTEWLALSALERDGFTEIEMVGSHCRVARAFDKEGQKVEAYACGWLY